MGRWGWRCSWARPCRDIVTPAPFHSFPDTDETPAEAFHVTADDGVALRIALWREVPGAPLGTVLLFSGRTEYAEKYAPVAQDLNRAGYAVITVDWRGQGLSQRLMDDPRPGHVGRFSDYQHDVVALAAAALELDLPKPWFLLAHSMGGCIGLEALHNGLEVRSAVFSAPMWGIQACGSPSSLGRWLATLVDGIGLGRRAVPGTGGSTTYVTHAGFEANVLTRDGLNWARLVAEATLWPELTLGGATYHWVREALQECERLALLPSPHLPALISLGSREAVVSQAAIRKRAAEWPGARLLEVPGGKHEVLFETPSHREAFLSASLQLFAETA